MTTASVLLISSKNDTHDYLRLACLHLPVRVLHTKEGHTGMVLARSCAPSVILIDASDLLSHNGWVIARLIQLDDALKDIPVVVLTDSKNAEHLARKSQVYYHMPRQFSIPDMRKLIRYYVDSFPVEAQKMPA